MDKALDTELDQIIDRIIRKTTDLITTWGVETVSQTTEGLSLKFDLSDGQNIEITIGKLDSDLDRSVDWALFNKKNQLYEQWYVTTLNGFMSAIDGEIKHFIAKNADNEVAKAPTL